MVHICDAMVVTCIDFRFQKFIEKWLDKTMAEKTFDRVGFAGSTKELNTIIKQLDISVKLHHINQVILIHHEDCGAYGTDSTHDRHELDLLKAKTVMNAIYPDLKVDLYYLHLDGKFELVK